MYSAFFIRNLAGASLGMLSRLIFSNGWFRLVDPYMATHDSQLGNLNWAGQFGRLIFSLIQTGGYLPGNPIYK